MKTHEMPSAEKKEKTSKERLLELLYSSLDASYGRDPFYRFPQAMTVGEAKEGTAKEYRDFVARMRHEASRQAIHEHAGPTEEINAVIAERSGLANKDYAMIRAELENLLKSYAKDDTETIGQLTKRLEEEIKVKS